jgi:DNA-binding winged helix-turn-helix (wHTH) protein
MPTVMHHSDPGLVKLAGAHGWRQLMGTHGVVSFGPFRLFAAERQLKKGDEPLQLGSRTLDTLIALVERAGEVVTQRELISRVWPGVTVQEANLRIDIASLRKALGDGREDARYIVTVSGRGYCFVAPVTLSTQQSLPSREVAVSDRLQRLPPKLTRMIGRDDAIRTLSERLMMSRFVSIVGPGGIGKTTVAISVAHMLSDGFNGAVFFVDLAALTDARLVPTAAASALGLMVQTQDPVVGLLAFIGDRKILLVLDNCEHVIGVAAALAERVVSEAPQAHILATSREALRVEGEQVHLLYSLDCPPDNAGLTAMEALQYPATQLFMERAAASGYGAALSDTDAPIVARSCRRLDGIALAIELAASRVGSLGIRGTAELLGPAGAIEGRELGDEEIAAILGDLKRTPLGVDESGEFRISLAGAQEKTALLHWDDKWQVPHGSTATTHILKPEIGRLPNEIDLSQSIENEHLCMRLTAAFGLPTARTEIREFAGRRAPPHPRRPPAAAAAGGLLPGALGASATQIRARRRPRHAPDS